MVVVDYIGIDNSACTLDLYRQCLTAGMGVDAARVATRRLSLAPRSQKAMYVADGKERHEAGAGMAKVLATLEEAKRALGLAGRNAVDATLSFICPPCSQIVSLSAHDRVDAEVSIRDGMTTTRWAWDLACKLRKSSPRHYCTFENSDRVINYWADERYM